MTLVEITFLTTNTLQSSAGVSDKQEAVEIFNFLIIITFVTLVVKFLFSTFINITMFFFTLYLLSLQIFLV